MNCTDFRRAALAHGHVRFSDAGKGHLDACSACRGFASALSLENEMLQRALAVEVPPGLADRVLISGHRKSRSLLGVLTAASMAVVAAGVFLAAGWQWQVARRVATDMIDHVVTEPEALEATGVLPAERLNAALGFAGLTARTTPGQVRSAGACKMPGGTGQHLVVDTPQGRVTIIVAPPGTQTSFSRGLAHAGYYAEVLPGRLAAVGVVSTERRAVEAVVAVLDAS